MQTCGSHQMTHVVRFEIEAFAKFLLSCTFLQLFDDNRGVDITIFSLGFCDCFDD